MARLGGSLRSRIQAGLFVGLLLACLLLAWASTTAMRQIGEALMLARMQHDAESLLAIIEPGAHDRAVGTTQLTRVYQQPYSGHYWQVSIEGETAALSSRSLWDQSLQFPTLTTGQTWTGHTTGPLGQALIIHAGGYHKQGRNLTLAVAEDLEPVESRIREFQWRSAATLAAIAAGLLLLQHLLLRRSFNSLDELKQGIDELRHGRSEALDERLPSEVRPLAVELNRLLRQMQQRLNHSRNALGNLAHALKAPVAVIIHDLERRPGDAGEARQALQQAQRLRDLIQRELRRARLATAGRPAQTFRPLEDGQALIDSLRHLHGERELDIEMRSECGAMLPFDLEDMLELLGNLLDNACKWAHRQVRCVIRETSEQLEIEIADDGDGVSAELIQRLTERGLRADEAIEGSGLGLAIVKDLVEHYAGQLDFDRDPELGGLRVSVRLPLRAPD